MVVLITLILAILVAFTFWYFYSHQDGKVKLLYRNPIVDDPQDAVRPSRRVIKSDRNVGYKLRKKFKYSLGKDLEDYVKVLSRAYGIKIRINRNTVNNDPKYHLWVDEGQYVIDVSATSTRHDWFLTCCIFLIVHHILFDESDVHLSFFDIKDYDPLKVDRIAAFIQGLIDSSVRHYMTGELYRRVRDLDC